MEAPGKDQDPVLYQSLHETEQSKTSASKNLRSTTIPYMYDHVTSFLLSFRFFIFYTLLSILYNVHRIFDKGQLRTEP